MSRPATNLSSIAFSSKRSLKAREVEIARALVKQRRDHVRDAGLVGGVLARPAAEGELHRHQRQRGFAHECDR